MKKILLLSLIIAICTIKTTYAMFGNSFSNEFKNQINNVCNYADALINNDEEVYLILGSANVEIEALTDKSKAKNWVFWNLSSNEGAKSDHEFNPFIDISFNDKAALEYASQHLNNKFTRIVVPQQVIEYTQWKIYDFSLWNDMLRSGGSIEFALDWLGENATQITYQTHKVSNDLVTEEKINELNRFDLSYEDREKYLAETYNRSLDKVFGFLSIVKPPYFSTSMKNLELDLDDSFLTLTNEIQTEINEAINNYNQFLSKHEHEYKDLDFNEAAFLLYSKSRKEFKIGHPIQQLIRNYYSSKTPFLNEEELHNYFTKELTLGTALKTFNSNIGKAYNQAKENWLIKEFSTLFSHVSIDDINKNDAQNDIPSRAFKLGYRVIRLIK